MLFGQIASKANKSCETGESDAGTLLGRFQPALSWWKHLIQHIKRKLSIRLI